MKKSKINQISDVVHIHKLLQNASGNDNKSYLSKSIL